MSGGGRQSDEEREWGIPKNAGERIDAVYAGEPVPDPVPYEDGDQ